MAAARGQEREFVDEQGGGDGGRAALGEPVADANWYAGACIVIR